MKIIIVLSLVAAFTVQALETDNFLTWDKTLPDSTEVLNKLIQDQIESVLKNSSLDQDISCSEITFRIANRFKTTPRQKLFEDYLQENFSERMYPKTPYYLFESIYRHTRRFYLSKSGLSPNLQANGVYFGVDKLSHFGSTGRRYLKHYLKKIRQGYSAQDAEKFAIRKGLSYELRIQGLWPSGVFSYADVEANYQGFLFYKKLCLDGQETYLEKSGTTWKLVRTPDMRDYVNPFWDETFHQSFFGSGMWSVSSKIILREYCPLRSSELVQRRFKYYREFLHTSPSLTYVEELQKQKHKLAPDPMAAQSIDKLCELVP